MFCGTIPGIFVPTAMVEARRGPACQQPWQQHVTDVPKCIGQLPLVLLNAVSFAVFKSVTTTYVCGCSGGDVLAAVLAGFVKMGTHACFEHADKIKLEE